MEPSFEKLLAHLADGGVDFILVGGLAVSLQGYVRFTEDVDILLSDDPSNIRRFLEVMSLFGEGFARELSHDDFADEEGAVRIIEETEECQLDVFTVMSGRKYADVLVDADVFEVCGKSIRYASKASLIGWKERSVREKDRLDAAALRRLIDDPRAFD
jgi:hypothetical protein